MNKEIEDIYDKKDNPDHIIESIYFKTAKELMSSYVKGYGRTLFGADWTVKDTELLNRVRNNLFSFSAAKSYAEANEIRNSVYDSEGNIRSRNDFRRSCRQIDAKYNERYLDAERNQVIAAGTHGSRWIDFENSADTHPYLEYVTARDSRVRKEHRALDGIILPINDPFWQQYYPPNSWNCRCMVKKRTTREYEQIVNSGKNKITDGEEASKIGGKNVKKGFRHNVGTSYIFDKDDHPYFKANAAAKDEQMSATKHYGLKSVEHIYSNPEKLSKYQGSIRTKEDYDVFWDTMEAEFGEEGVGFTLIDEKNHTSAIFTRKQLYSKLRDLKDEPTQKYTSPQKRWNYFDEVMEVFFHPDEVWCSYQNDTRSRKKYLTTVHLKYYEDAPIVLFKNERDEVLSFYKNTEQKNVERFRIGNLLQKKKR